MLLCNWISYVTISDWLKRYIHFDIPHPPSELHSEVKASEIQESRKAHHIMKYLYHVLLKVGLSPIDSCNSNEIKIKLRIGRSRNGSKFNSLQGYFYLTKSHLQRKIDNKRLDYWSSLCDTLPSICTVISCHYLSFNADHHLDYGPS